jgi:hypothetical protein
MKMQAVRPLVDAEHGDSRKDGAPGPRLFLEQRGLRIRALVEGAERAQERKAGLAGRALAFSPDILVFADDAVQAGERIERLFFGSCGHGGDQFALLATFR